MALSVLPALWAGSFCAVDRGNRAKRSPVAVRPQHREGTDLDGHVALMPCPKRAQTTWHEPSLGGSSWHEGARQRLDQLPDQLLGLQ